MPALKTLTLEFDKPGAIDTKGFATCTVQKLESTLTAQANAKYGKALIGEGEASAEIAFPAWSAAHPSALLREGRVETGREKPAKRSLPEACAPPMVLLRWSGPLGELATGMRVQMDPSVKMPREDGRASARAPAPTPCAGRRSQ